MMDLFSSGGGLESIPLSGADISYKTGIDFGEPPHKILQRLIEETHWKQESVSVWGKTFQQPRLTAWYGEKGKDYSYSGIKLELNDWTSLILGLKSKVESETGLQFNSVLLNYYRDENDSIGMHSDDEPRLGEQPAIASLSFGDERLFKLKPKDRNCSDSLSIKLQTGSLLLMRGDTQKNYKHGIDKVSRKIGARVNLTFRTII